MAGDIQKILDEETNSGKLPRGSWLVMRGQVETMHNSFFRLGLGIGFAVIFIYLLMAVNFQSWLDPFIILMALPGRLRRHSVDAVHHPDDLQRSLADGYDHGDRRGHRE